ncbi:MAG TPA: 5-bromo-4-chloroindolyl phosphate hydrolysis family protein [Chloroflexia bacterium]|nr:5-bromo-4-chloroindolyl phosphate hydrolysis family protein [Chloroflexia bacterium]
MKAPGRRFPPQVAWPLALGCAFAVLAVCIGVLALPFWLGGLVAVLVFVALYLILDPRSAQEVAGDAYTADASARVRRALDELQTVKQLTQRVTASAVATQVQTVGQMAYALLNEVQAKRPNELLSAATAVEYRLGKLREALAVYADLLSDPRAPQQARTTELTQRLTTRTLPALEQWLSNNLDRLHAGDILQLEVNLSQLEASQYEALK